MLVQELREGFLLDGNPIPVGEERRDPSEEEGIKDSLAGEDPLATEVLLGDLGLLGVEAALIGFQQGLSAV